MRNHSTKIFIFIIGIFLFSCSSELERPNRAFPGLRTLEPTNITNDGFVGNLEINGSLDDIITYGFVWQLPTKGQPDINDLKYFIQDKPENNNVSLNIIWDIPPPPTALIIKGFIQTNSRIVYGQSIFFEPLGGSPPIIDQIIPSSFSPGDTLCLIGEGFASLLEQNQVFIDQKSATIVENSTNKIKIIAPIVTSNNPNVEVRSWGKSTISNIELATSDPFISSFSESQVSMDQKITILGGNFSPNNSINQVIFSNDQITKNASVLESYSDSIVIRVPNLSTDIINSIFDVSVKVASKEYKKNGCIEFLKPLFSDQQMVASFCDTITIQGSNFSPIAANNDFITITSSNSSNPIEFINSTSTELKFLADENIEYSRQQTGLNVLPIQLNTNGHFDDTEIQIKPGNITSDNITIFTSSGEVSINLNGEDLSPFSNQYNLSIIDQENNIEFEGEITSSTCDNVSFRIDASTIPPGFERDDKLSVNIQYPGGIIEHEIFLQTDGTKKPLRRGPHGMIDRFNYQQGFSYNNKGYFLDLFGFSIRSYDPITNTWSDLANIPNGMANNIVRNQVVGDIAFHTWSDQGQFKMAGFNLINNEWTIYDTPIDGITPPPGEYMDFSINDKYYLAGAELWEYNPPTNSWTNISITPPDINISGEHSAFQISSKIYSFIDGQIIIYDPITDIWTTGATYGTNLVFDSYSTIAINNKLHLIAPNADQSQTTYSEYNPITDSWTLLETQYDRTHNGITMPFSIGNTAYIHYEFYLEADPPYNYSNFWAYTPE